jgi:hypothetical protein
MRRSPFDPQWWRHQACCDEAAFGKPSEAARDLNSEHNRAAARHTDSQSPMGGADWAGHGI